MQHLRKGKCHYRKVLFVILLIAIITGLYFNSFSSLHQHVIDLREISHLYIPSSVLGRKPTQRLEFVHITKTGGSAIEKVGAQHGIIWGACHYMNITDVGCTSPDISYTAPDFQSYALTSPWHTPPKILKPQVDTAHYPYKHDAHLFAVIRNPYDRMISEFYCPWTGYKGSRKTDVENMNNWIQGFIKTLSQRLKEYKAIKPQDRPKVQAKGLNEDAYLLAQKHYINQAEYVFDESEQVIQHVIYYENISTDFERLMKLYGLDLKLPDKSSEGVYNNNIDDTKLTYKDLSPETIAIINEYAASDFEKFGYEMVTSFSEEKEYSLLPKESISSKFLLQSQQQPQNKNNDTLKTTVTWTNFILMLVLFYFVRFTKRKFRKRRD